MGEEGFYVLFPTNKLDSIITISEVIGLDRKSQKSYASLAVSEDGILKQNRFYFDLQLALLQKNVFFAFKENVRKLQSLEVFKVVFFDGLTKDSFFDGIFTVTSAIAITRIKLGQFRDSILPSNAGRTDDNRDLK
jgi:hypothetical protein